MLAVAMIAGIAVRAAAAVSVALLLEIVVSLAITSGLSDLVLRDVGPWLPDHGPTQVQGAEPDGRGLSRLRR